MKLFVGAILFNVQPEEETYTLKTIPITKSTTIMLKLITRPNNNDSKLPVVVDFPACHRDLNTLKEKGEHRVNRCRLVA